MFSAKVYKQPGRSHGKYAFVCVFVLCFLFARFHFSCSFQILFEKFKYVNFFYQPLITLNLMGNVPER